jgi:hypothetical protein
MKKEFIISIGTEFGSGIIKKQASSFKEAYLKCALKWRKKAYMIEDEDGESISIDELLGLELDA